MTDMEWQPISTAPKDGTVVLLCGGATSEDSENDERPVTAFWDDDAWAFAFWDLRWRGTYIEPTHWMPITPITKD